MSLDPETSINNEVEQICSEVRSRSIFAQIPRGTKINDVEYKGGAGIDFTQFGDGLEFNSSVWSNNENARLFETLIEKGPLDPQDGKPGTILLTVWDEVVKTQGDYVILGVGGRSRPINIDKMQRGNSKSYTLFAEMPRSSADRLIEIVSNSPQMLELFYQKVFKNLDSDQSQDTGLKRVKADKVKIVDLEQIKSEFNNTYIDDATATTILNEIKPLFFSKTVGVVA